MNYIIYPAIFIFGASIGSFLNVLIDRLPKNKSILGRSHCDYCGKKIAWHDLIPVISFFVLRGKSRCCHKRLSLQYPLVEIITGTLYILVFIFQFSVFNDFSIFSFQFFELINLWGIVSCLIVIFFSDFKYHLISDWILLTLFVFSVLFRLGSGNPIPTITGLINQTPTLILSGLIVSFPIGLIYFISRERAMGLGDVYLSAIIGFLLGWKEGFIALYIAFVTGAIFGIILMIFQKKKLKSKIAFGPFIVIGTIVMLFWGERVMEMIKKIYGF